MKFYKTIRRKATPYLLVGALAFGYAGCEKNNEEYPSLITDKITIEQFEQREKLEQESKKRVLEQKLNGLSNEYNSNLKNLENSLNKYILDGKLTTDEQEALYNLLEKAGESKRNYNDLSRCEVLKYPARFFELYKLLENNLCDLGIGVPELEKVLRNQGLNIHVDGKITSCEVFYVSFFLVYSLFMGGILYGAKRKK